MRSEPTVNRVWSAVSPEWKLTISGDAAPGAVADDAALATADDRALVAATLDGRREAFDEIVRRHQRQVYQVCFRFAGNHEDASDLVQDVFVRAYRGLRGFKGNSLLGTWLYRIAVNTSLNRVGARTPSFEAIDRVDRADRAVEPADTAVLRKERAREVRAAIAKLPDRQRTTLILRVYHDLPHEEIARIVGSSVGAVKANFFHALGNLKKLLRERR